MVKFFDDEITAKKEATVLYDLARPANRAVWACSSRPFLASQCSTQLRWTMPIIPELSADHQRRIIEHQVRCLRDTAHADDDGCGKGDFCVKKETALETKSDAG